MNILVVDDMEVNRLIIKKVLQNMAVSVDEAVDGVEAVEKCRAEKFDIVFMDVSMPHMDGITAMNTIRSEGDHDPHIVGFSSDISEDDYHLYGFDGYITKPFDIKDLVKVVNAYKDSIKE